KGKVFAKQLGFSVSRGRAEFAKPLYGLTPVSRVRIPPSPPDVAMPVLFDRHFEMCRLSQTAVTKQWSTGCWGEQPCASRYREKSLKFRSRARCEPPGCSLAALCARFPWTLSPR